MSVKRSASETSTEMAASMNPEKQRRIEDASDSQETVGYSMDAETMNDVAMIRSDSGASVETMPYPSPAPALSPDDSQTPDREAPQVVTDTTCLGSTKSPDQIPSLQPTESINKDAKIIAEMLNISDVKPIEAQLNKIRTNANRVEIVLNMKMDEAQSGEKMDSGIANGQNTTSHAHSSVQKTDNLQKEESVKPSCSSSLKQEVTRGDSYSDEVVDMIFVKMCKVYKDLKHRNQTSDCDLNRVFKLVKENLHQRKCVDFVVGELLRDSSSENGRVSTVTTQREMPSKPAENCQNASNEEQVSQKVDHGTALQTKPADSSEKADVEMMEVVTSPTKFTPEAAKSSPSPTKSSPSPTKLRSVMSDARSLIQNYPGADPNKIYTMLESLKDNPDRVELVKAQISGSDDKKPSTETTDPQTTDPLMKDTRHLSTVFPNIDQAEIYAYLEAHHDKPNRMEIVMEELLSTNRDSQGNTLEETPHDAAEVTELKSVIGAQQLGPLAALERDVDQIRAVFPDVDPMYLYTELEGINDKNRVAILSARMSERNTYPRLKERLEKAKKEERRRKILTMNFDMEEFLSQFPDPKKTFYETEKQMNAVYQDHVRILLRNTFPMLVTGYLNSVMEKHKHHLTPCLREIEKVAAQPPPTEHAHGRHRGRRGHRGNKFRSHPRRPVPMPADPEEYFYKEYIFTQHEQAIMEHLTAKETAEKERFEQAKNNGELQECQCCYDGEVLPENMHTCPNAHSFCRECIRRAMEAAIGEGKTSLGCLISTDCDSQVPMATLQEVLDPRAMHLLLRKIQEEEIRAAHIEGLESCPFCSYACVMNNVSSSVFQCHNPECMRESCRACREASHVPLRCDEVEKQGEADMRTFIENRMTEAMIRTCYRCNKRFYKTEGCNMMTCSCGAHMCYVCRKPIKGYEHFEENEECSHSKDVLTLHHEEMSKAAQEAKQKYEQEHPEAAGTSLKHDPMKLLQNQGAGDAFHAGPPGLHNPRMMGFGALPRPYLPNLAHNMFFPPPHPRLPMFVPPQRMQFPDDPYIDDDEDEDSDFYDEIDPDYL